MQKKMLTIITALAILLLTITASALAADVPSEWAREAITSAVEKGFVPVDIQSNYTQPITRLEYCKMAVMWLEYALDNSIDDILIERGLTRDTTAFSDTSDPYILAAFALNVTGGVGGGLFDTSGVITREMSAVLLMRVWRIVGLDESDQSIADFSDISSASEWARDGIRFAAQNGIMSGIGNNLFSPKGTYTREQGIATFDRVPVASTATTPRKKTAAENPQNYSITNMHREACYPLSVWAGYRIPDGPGECMGLWVGSSASPNAAYTGSTGYLNVYDGKINTGLTNGNAGIKMGEKWILMEVRMLHSNSSANQRATIEGSNNGSAWVTLWDGTIPTSTLDFKAASGLSAFVNNTGYTQFRYTTAGTVYELEWWGYKAPTQTSWPAPIAPPSSVSVLERTAWELVNTERAKYGLRPADWNTTLASAARVEATYNRNRGSLMHRINGYVNGFNGMAFDYLIMGRTTAATAVNGFLDSETHRGAIYTGTNMGIGQDGGFWCFINGTPGT